MAAFRVELPWRVDAFSGMISYRPAKRVEAYGGSLWSQVTGGLVSGYLDRVASAPRLASESTLSGLLSNPKAIWTRPVVSS